jgi:hypothetical protein
MRSICLRLTVRGRPFGDAPKKVAPRGRGRGQAFRGQPRKDSGASHAGGDGSLPASVTWQGVTLLQGVPFETVGTSATLFRSQVLASGTSTTCSVGTSVTFDRSQVLDSGGKIPRYGDGAGGHVEHVSGIISGATRRVWRVQICTSQLVSSPGCVTPFPACINALLRVFLKELHIPHGCKLSGTPRKGCTL